MLQLVFMLPFEANPSRLVAQTLGTRVGLTMNRIDDWDTQVGFRLIGETGALRLFRRNNTKDEGGGLRYEFYGTATKTEDCSKVGALFETCQQAVNLIKSHIDRESVIEPPGLLIDGQSGSDQPSE